MNDEYDRSIYYYLIIIDINMLELGYSGICRRLIKTELPIYQQILGLPPSVYHYNEFRISLSWGLHERVRLTCIIYLTLII